MALVAEPLSAILSGGRAIAAESRVSANPPHRLTVEPRSVSMRSTVRLGGRERGVTLIESLIALLVLSIALLGVGALQLMTQRDEIEARWRSAAVAMSGNLIEQLRTDRVASEGIGIRDGAPVGCSGPNQWLCDLITVWLSSLGDQLPHAAAQLKILKLDGDLLKADLSIAWRRLPDDDAQVTCRPQDADFSVAADGGCLRLETIL